MRAQLNKKFVWFLLEAACCVQSEPAGCRLFQLCGDTKCVVDTES